MTTSGAGYLDMLYLQGTLDLSATATGLIMLPFSLPVVAGPALSAVLLPRLPRPALPAAGLTTVAVAMFIATHITTVSGAVLILVSGALAGFGLGLASVAATTVGTRALPADDQGLASGVLNTSAQLGTALGIAVLASTAAARADALPALPGHAALVAGYRLGYLVAAGAALLAVLPAVLLLGRGRSEKCQRTAEGMRHSGRMQQEPDWVAVVAEQRCGQCGLTASAVSPEQLPDALRDEGARWHRILDSTPPVALRRRPAPQVWSPLEYGAHVRGALAVLAGRVERTLAEDSPRLGWWDHEAAVESERYNEQEPRTVGRELQSNALRLADILERVRAGDWNRPAVRGDGERFTVLTLGRYALHEARHHRYDVTGTG